MGFLGPIAFTLVKPRIVRTGSGAMPSRPNRDDAPPKGMLKNSVPVMC